MNNNNYILREQAFTIEFLNFSDFCQGFFWPLFERVSSARGERAESVDGGHLTQD